MIDKRIKYLREQKGLTQKELAKELDVAPSTIGMYESGKRVPDSNMLGRIANYFNVSIDYLLGRTEMHYAAMTALLDTDKKINSNKKLIKENNLIYQTDETEKLGNLIEELLHARNMYVHGNYSDEERYELAKKIVSLVEIMQK